MKELDYLQDFPITLHDYFVEESKLNCNKSISDCHTSIEFH